MDSRIEEIARIAEMQREESGAPDTPETKRRKRAAQQKVYNDANKDKARAYRDANKERIAARGKAYQLANKPRLKAALEAKKKTRSEQGRRYRQANKERLAEERMEKRALSLGLTLQELRDMYDAHGGCCGICGTHESDLSKKLAIDHDHDTGQVRGLLCATCNAAMGGLGDTVEGLQRAIAYLKRADKDA